MMTLYKGRRPWTLFLQSALLSILFITGCVAICPDGWEENSGRCYYFSYGKVASLPWHEAQAQCERMGANLAVVIDATEDLFLFARMSDAVNLWLGLHDLDQYDNWQWVDGTPLTYTNWKPGQPDHWQNAPGGTENCVAIPSHDTGLWNDQSCSIPSSYVCERSNDADTIPRCNVQDGWTEINGKCYKYVDTLVEWTTANDACKAMGADLAAVTSEGEQKALSIEINSKNTNTWIGLTNVNHVTQDLYWSNEVDSYSPSSSYNNWDTDEPATSQYSSCVYMRPDATDYAPWKATRCGNEHAYICESGLTGSCADGWRLAGDTCYFFALNQNTWGTWVDARDRCAAMGGHMLVIKDEAEQQYISQKLPDFVDVDAAEFWLGISDSVIDGTFAWEDGVQTPVATPGRYTNWNKNQPQEREDTWDCVQIYTGFYLGRWETTDCFRIQPYVCELPPGVDPKPLVPVANTHKGCDPGWLWFDGNCYFFNFDVMVSWSEAESKCVEMGAHLASVASGEENSFIVDHVSADTWIGGHAVLDVYNFEWSDDSPWVFTNWYTGEPNNIEQGCVQLWKAAGSMWDDSGCKVLKNYVCKKPEQDCWEPLGMESRRILDQQITASSQWDANHAPYHGRLNNSPNGQHIGAWAATTADMQTQGTAYLQIQLLPKRTVAGVTTQGRPLDWAQWITSYKISYSDDGNAWTFVRDGSSDMIFTGNVDMNTKVTNKLPTPIHTNYIRIVPWTYYGAITMRAELLGCTDDGNALPTATPQAECTSVSYQDRLDCGYPGVTSTECRSRGCCWDSDVPDTTWCFYKQGDYDTRCGRDWMYDPGGQLYCYHFNPYIIRDWNDAQLYCYNIGGDLLSINSLHEQYYVTAHITGLVSASALWIGGNQLDASRGWKWTDGGPFSFKNWRAGEPNDWTGNEDCIEMYVTDGTWNDNPCNYQRGVACKKAINEFPIDTEDGKLVVNICEGETGTLICGGNQAILIHHASYGRSSPVVCGNGHVVPEGGCHSTDSMDLVSDMCCGRSTCQIQVTNEAFGDPCYGVFKYLNVIYSCETNTCFDPLGMEDGTITNAMISESSSLDASHRGANGRLNSQTSWATNEGIGAWIQILLPKHMKISGLQVQGAKDADRWVETFKIAFAKDSTNSVWVEYENYDNQVEIIDGSSDRNSVVQVYFSENIYSTGIRVYPLTWNGDMIGMRLEVTGCNPFQEVTCNTLGDQLYAGATTGDIKSVDCPAFCPEYLGYQYNVYGDKIYAGISQVCVAAIHAGVLIDRLGGSVTLKFEEGQSVYQGTSRHNIVSQDLDNYTPVAFSFTDPEKNCPTGWVPFGGYCYLAVLDELPWQNAEATCILLGGNMVSIFNSVEQDFVWQLMVLSGQQCLWIGLSDVITQNEYQWTDGTIVAFTEWDSRQPDRNEKSCVHFHIENGRWDDDVCETPRPFMCKKFKDYYIHEPDSEPTAPPGCPTGWVPYHGLCYLFQRDPTTYVDSKQFCSDQGGTTIDILDKYTQSFLHMVIGSEDYRWWLGLTGTPIIGGSAWTWESGYPLSDYDNWGRGSPDITNGECAVFFGGQYGSGMWYSYRCENQAYSICQKQREGYTPPPKTTLPPSGGCPGGWITPDENSGHCYRIYKLNEYDWDGPVSWNNAYHQCLATGGDLVSIHSVEEDAFLITLLQNTMDESMGFWIGLNNKASASEIIETGWEWSDGSSVSYVSWTPGYPENARENNCVELAFNVDLQIASWRNLDCDQKRDWMCKLKKGIDEIIPTEPPTGKPNSQCGSADAGTWLEYNDFCYSFNDFQITNFYDAEETCMKSGGHLASIHEHNEQSFITNQIQQMNGTNRFWIGIREVGGVDGEYLWLDETPLDFVNWNAGEPNDHNGQEQCVYLLSPQGRWNDANCGIGVAGYICKKRFGDPPIEPQPTEKWPGGCPSDWLMYDNYCYQIHGEYTDCATDTEDWSDGQCRGGWYESREICRSLGNTADLVAIHNKYENAFVASAILRVPIDVWIGMSDEQWWDKYIWSNGDKVTYTNWYTNEPNHWNGEERCVQMYHREDIVGRWNDQKCDHQVSYVCQMDKDPSIEPGLQINNNNRCPDGWMQYDTINDHYICYYLDTTERTFSDAMANCQSLRSGAALVSYQTMFEQAFVTSYIRDTTAWIGLTYQTDEDDPEANQWLWVDNWPVWISNWGEGEPGSDPNKLCALNKDSLLGSEWVTEDCSMTYPSICRWTTENVPPTPGTIVGTCPDGGWGVYGGFCYKAFPTLGETSKMFVMSDAEVKCNEYFGHLVSIGSRAQTEWLNSWSNTSEALWIGLRNNGQGGWQWTDNRPVAYTNWNSQEPNNWGEKGEDCVEMLPNGKWNDIDCDKLQGYMCKVPKIIGTDSNGNVIHFETPAPIPPKSGASAGVIVGAVLGSLAGLLLIAGVVYYYYRNDGFSKKSSGPAPLSFDNPQYSVSGDKGLDVSGTSNA